MPVRISPALLVVQGALSAEGAHKDRLRRVPRPLVLQRVHVIDATGAPTRPDRSVCIVGGCIEAIGPAGSVAIPANARVLDAGGAFLVPGLWDMHVHLALMGESALPLLVTNGVTTVRDVSDGVDQLDTWRRRIDAGVLVGPRIVASGRPVEGAAWLDRVRTDPAPPTSTRPAEGAALMDAWARRRASLMFPGFSVHDELDLLVRRIGWTPLQALMGATRAPAEHFGLQLELGTIEPGKIADLVLLDADPLQDIRHTRRIRAVVRSGRLLTRADLDRLLRQLTVSQD